MSAARPTAYYQKIGKMTSRRKAQAARANGKKGGRPKKHAK